MFQDAYIDYIRHTVEDLTISVRPLESWYHGSQEGLQLKMTHASIRGFRKGWQHLSSLINSVCIPSKRVSVKLGGIGGNGAQ